MEQEKEYSIECNIPYEPVGGLARLISKGYDAVKEKGFKLRFLEFVGGGISLHLNSNKSPLDYENYFDPSMVHCINIKIEDNTQGKLKDLTRRILEYFLENPDPSIDLCMCPGEGKEGKTHRLTIQPKFSLNDREDYVELSTKAGNKYQEEFLKKVLEIIGVRDIKYGRALIGERLKTQFANDNFIGGNPKELQITLDSVLSTYGFLLDSKIPFDLTLSNLIKGPNNQSFHYSQNGSIKDINMDYDPLASCFIFLHLSYEPSISLSVSCEQGLEKETSRFEELVNSLKEDIIFREIIYDTEDLRKAENHDKNLEKIYNRFSSGQISLKDYERQDEEERIRYYTEIGKGDKDAKAFAKSFTKGAERFRTRRVLFLLKKFISNL